MSAPILGMGAPAMSSETRDRYNSRVDSMIALYSTWPPRGNRPGFRSLENRQYYRGFDQLVRPPSKQAPLAPLRDDVPLLDTCSGHVSAGSAVVLGITDRPGFLDSFNHVPSALWVPTGVRRKPQTQSSLSNDMSIHDNAWNSRRFTDAALRACFFGWNSALKDKQPPEKEMQEDVKLAVKHMVYTSATQRSYEEVDWDAKLPPRIKPPTTTLEKITDSVSHRSSWKPCSPPQLLHMTGAQGNSCQLVPMKDVRKPISFCSPCPKSGQIPLYSDSCAIIPGYEGMRVWANTGEKADFPTQYPGANTDLRTPKFGHKSPLSRMVTIASKNPFLNPNISALLLK